MRLDVKRLRGYPKYYDWGDPDALYRLLNWEKQPRPLAEVWFGTHPAGLTTTAEGQTLRDYLASSGESSELSYLLKYIAPAKPLSIQVHPNADVALQGYNSENERGIALESPDRIFKDPHAKPEMLFAMSDMQVLLGVAPLSVLEEFLESVGGPLANRSKQLVKSGETDTLFKQLATGSEGFSTEDIRSFVDRCHDLTATSSNAVLQRAQLVTDIARTFPDDPGIIMAAVMNSVNLSAGQALYVGVGDIHAYISGVGIELMTTSDNVFRAGLTAKHIDIDRFLGCANFTSGQPALLIPTIVEGQGVRTTIYTPFRCHLCLDIHRVDRGDYRLFPRRNAIVTCLEGEFELEGLGIVPGDTIFLTEIRKATCLSKGTLLVASDESNPEN